MTAKRTGPWRLAQKIMSPKLPFATHRAVERAVLQEAQYFRKKVVEAFNTSGASNGKVWTPNKATTIRSKGKSKPLIDKGDLRSSIAVMQQGPAIFVGVSNNKRHRDGQLLIDIASVHEFGKIIAVTITPKMLAFLHANAEKIGLGLGSGGTLAVGKVMLIEIPKRSFLQATADAHFAPGTVRPRFLARVGQNLGGFWAVLGGNPAKYTKGGL